MRRVSIIKLLLPNGDLVLQRRTKDAVNSPGMLGCFGGHIEGDESPLEAMKRELSEETSLDVPGLKITSLATVEMLDSRKNGEFVRFHYYQADIPNADFEVYEGDGAEAYSITELKKRPDLSTSTRYMIEHLDTEIAA
jgi:8-oxo-dGTP pyrophosphatase MutT (NUDIX family)